MGLFAALILAFAQPFTAKESAFKKKELAIYLDNSFSMQARQGQSTLLEEATQELINSVPEEMEFSLFTNDSEYRRVSMEEIRNSLLQPSYSSDQLTLREIILKGRSYFSQGPNVLHSLVILSDFQESMRSDYPPDGNSVETYLVPVRAEDVLNVSIDTVFIDQADGSGNNLVIGVSGNRDFGSIPVSLFDKGKLIGKSAVTYQSDQGSRLVFTLPAGEDIEGVVTLSDQGLAYDNAMSFNISTREKIRILGVGAGGDYLSRLFGDEITEYRMVESLDRAVSLLPDQDLVILNEINTLPASASEKLMEFVTQGGSLLLIPSMESETEGFNRLLSPFGLSLSRKKAFELEITEINYAHPLFADVFKSKVNNFQYPLVREYFTINGRGEKVLAYSSEEPFLASRGKVYVFSASLNPENSNFTSSPLVVPTLYAMAMSSRSIPTLYYLLGTRNSVDIPVRLGEDRILSLKKGDQEFIPRQQAIGRMTRLWFDENPSDAGTYRLNNPRIERAFSFNYPRTESDLSYADLGVLGLELKVVDTITELFTGFEKDNAVRGLWKWFVILALLFLLAEVIIQKVLK